MAWEKLSDARNLAVHIPAVGSRHFVKHSFHGDSVWCYEFRRHSAYLRQLTFLLQQWHPFHALALAFRFHVVFSPLQYMCLHKLPSRKFGCSLSMALSKSVLGTDGGDPEVWHEQIAQRFLIWLEICYNTTRFLWIMGVGRIEGVWIMLISWA